MNYEHSRSGPDKDVTRYRQLQAHRCEITRGIAANLINFGGVQSRTPIRRRKRRSDATALSHQIKCDAAGRDTVVLQEF
jgi:hypothetical protein